MARSKLKESDKELLLTKKKFRYDEPKNSYFGGYFGNSSEDYVEVMIYDTSDNLLETSVADSSDYYYDSEKGGIKLKTGTILRKLGYDRGRFKVTYNFLRKVAGSYETLVTNENDEIVNGDIDINEIDKSLFIKENKYISHEISPSRTEIRLIAQRIQDEKYLRDFYRLAARNKKVIADGTDLSNIEFVGNTYTEKENSKQIKFSTDEGSPMFEQSMIGGTISIPNFFLVDRIFPPPVVTADQVGLNPTEQIGGDLLQASFFLDENAGTKNIEKNSTDKFGDVYFSPAYDYFKDIEDGVTISKGTSGIDFEGDGRTIGDVRNLSDSTFNVVYLTHDDPRPEIDIVSNSSLRADASTTYTWEVTGFDMDRKSNGDKKFERVQPRPDGEDEGGDFRIVTPGDEYATRDAQSEFRAVQTVTGQASGEGVNTRPGGRLRLQLFSKDLHLGIKLTIRDNTANDESTIHLPAIIETH